MVQTWLVTGSATGLGRAVVEAALAAGHQVVATALKVEELDAIGNEHPDHVLKLALNVTSEAEWAAAVAATVDHFGDLDVLVNSAGVGVVGAVQDMTLDQINAPFRINFTGTVLGCRAVVPTMRQQGHGKIVLVSSIGARAATPGAAVYFASKAAISTFAESFALEVAPFGIAVTAIEPGGMRTNFAEPTSTPMIEPSAGYEETAGKTITLMRSPQYDQAIRDPAGHAALILQVAALDDAPARLLAGTDAFDRGMSVATTRAAADARFEQLSRSA
jgi:NAD(P)-dependent dehydrogenase (short-subunit alcohol dehydrogenase family)